MFDILRSAILFFTLLLSIFFLQKLLQKRNIKNPPGPLRLPIIGHLHLLSPVFHKALYSLSKRYGPLFRVFLGSVPCVVVSSPEITKEFFKTHETSFCNRPKISAIHYLTYNSQDFAFTPYGPYWKFMKKLCMSQLLGDQTLDMLLPVRRDEIKHLIESIAKQSSSGNAVDVRGELIRMMNNVISRMVMNKRCSGDENEALNVRKLIEEASKICGKFNMSDVFWFCNKLDLQGFEKKLKEVRDKFDEMMEMIIEEHKMERRKRKKNGVEDVKDLLDMLLDISEDENSEFQLTGDNIKAFIMDMFTGGTDTSAIAIEWALAELINHPNIMQKAAQEIDKVVGKNRLVQESDMINLPYLQAIVKETLRLHPPGGPFIMRESSQDFTVQGYHISSKTRLLFHVWAIGRDPSYWDNPLEFRPERFINEDQGSLKSQLDVRGQNCHFLPFGSGRRGCPGTSLALHVVQCSLGAMIQCFEWNGMVNMEEGQSATLPMAYPLLCVPVPRLNPLPHLATWDPNVDCCEWDAIECDIKSPYRVIQLTIFQAEISGHIPAAFGDLPYLQELVFHHITNLTGTIPPSIAKLTNLNRLDISYTNLSGPIPTFLTKLKKLFILNLSFNDFTGFIPAEFSQLKNLGSLHLDRNKLTGTIPESFGHFTESGLYLYLSHNHLSGTVPKSLGNSNISVLDLSRNNL